MGLFSYFRRKRQEKRELQEKQKYRTFVRDVVALYERDGSVATINGVQRSREGYSGHKTMRI